jgi:SAM-dependent methyltransferase
VAENFRLHGAIPFVPANLNESFANQFGGQFDAIMASEIIEHLENPRHFARECFKLLKQGGHLFLSTPNVNSPSSIVNFMRTGTFTWFGELEYERDGHITPLSKWQIEKSFTEAGFRFLWTGSYGDEWGKLEGSPRLLLIAKFVKMWMRMPNDFSGQIFVSVLEKPAM